MTILTWLALPIVKRFIPYVLGGFGILSLIGGFAWQQQNVGAKKEVARAKIEGKKIHARASKKAAEASRNPVIPCRDC